MEDEFMRHVVLWLVPLLLLLPAAQAQEQSNEEKPGTPAEEYRSLRKQYDKAVQEFQEAMQQAALQERQKVYQEQFPKLQAFLPKILKLAQDHPKESFASNALTWVIQNSRDESVRSKAVQVLLRDHPDNDELGQVCQMLANSQDAAAEKDLRTILGKNPHHEIQGQAAFALAQYLHTKADDLPENSQEKAKLDKEAEKYFGTVVESYADVKQGNQSLAEQAKRELFALRNLVVGKPAPNIEGEDSDGKKFQLRDYQGKVVVLDFWAGW
jgi:hypothetical protein